MRRACLGGSFPSERGVERDVLAQEGFVVTTIQAQAAARVSYDGFGVLLPMNPMVVLVNRLQAGPHTKLLRE